MTVARMSSILLLLASPAAAVEYPCPSDPGFCYRDVGNDGCFDGGVDEGPINEEIETSEEFPVPPEPGSIVCPPSVGSLVSATPSGDLHVQTAPGSSILLYGAKVVVRHFRTISGGDLLLGGLTDGRGSSIHQAQGDVEISVGADLDRSASPNRGFLVESTGGSILVGRKARFFAGSVASFSAPAGDVTFGDGVKVRLRDGTQADVLVEAGGSVGMARPRFDIQGRQQGATSSVFEITGAEITITGKATFKTKGMFSPLRFDITASGDVTIERLLLTATAPVTIQGANVTIGVEQRGKVRPSRMTGKRAGQTFEVVASEALSIKGLRWRGMGDAGFATTGTTIELLDGDLAGSGTEPVIDVAAGAGSVCDLTGTRVKKATLVTSCDTVVGL